MKTKDSPVAVNPNPDDAVNLNIKIPRSLNNAFEKRAKERLTTKSTVIREILLRHVQGEHKQAA